MKFADKWMDLENNQPEETYETQNDKYVMHLVICGCELFRL